MLCEVLLFLLVLSLSSESNTNRQLAIQSNFKKLGKLATGLSYGHLHATLDFSTLKQSHESFEKFLIEQYRTATTLEEKSFIRTVQGNLAPSGTDLKRIELAFFQDVTHRPKRQALLGLGFGSGLISMGMSIYNTYQISKLYSKFNNMETGFDHVVHVFEEENHAINTLSNSVNNLKQTCQIVLAAQRAENNEIKFVSHMVLATSLIQTHNAKVSSWARGLEALLHGHLYPTLVNPTKLQHAVQIMLEMADKRGLKPLHQEKSAIFKDPISFVATADLKLIVIIHVPLIDQDPIDLFEHLPIPFELGSLFILIESDRQILATDATGNLGLELTKLDLLHCQTEKSHSGNTFVCPNTNLLRNDIRKSCLGSLFFGQKAQILSKCQQYIRKISEAEDFAIQTGPEKFIIFAKETTSILRVCKNGTKTIQNATGLLTIATSPNCSVVTDHHQFKPQINIDVEEEFLNQPIFLHEENLIGLHNPVDLEHAFSELQKIQEPGRKNLGQLKNWLRETEQANQKTTIGYGISFGSVAISCLIIFLLTYLFCQYKRSVSRISN